MVEQDNKFNNIMINDEICVETIVYSQSMHFEGTLVSIDDENIEILLSDGKNFKIPKNQIVKINSKKNTHELVSTICSETDEDQIDIDDKDYCGCIIYDIDFSIFEPGKENSEKLSYRDNSVYQLLNWGYLFESEVLKKYFETSIHGKSIVSIVGFVFDDFFKENKTSISLIVSRITKILMGIYKPNLKIEQKKLYENFCELCSEYISILYYNFAYDGKIANDSLDCLSRMHFLFQNLDVLNIDDSVVPENDINDFSKKLSDVFADMISSNLLFIYQAMMVKSERSNISVSDLFLNYNFSENPNEPFFLLNFLANNICMLHVGKHLPGNAKLFKRLLEP